MLTKEELMRWARQIWEEAFAADPYLIEEVTRKLLGRDVFVWSNLTCAELRALSRACFPTALVARG